jgi:hypothetical protein
MFFSHRVTVPSVTDSPNAGRITSLILDTYLYCSELCVGVKRFAG